jgi:putative PIN family toxin of toxin-antitoxin system
VIRATLDANVLAPGFTSRGSASGQIIARWRAREFELVISTHLLRELARALTDPYFAARLEPDEALAIVTELRTIAALVEPTVAVRGVATHPEDDLVLSAALSGQAEILCTRDKQLLKLRDHAGLAILSPGEFLSFLETESLP